MINKDPTVYLTSEITFGIPEGEAQLGHMLPDGDFYTTRQGEVKFICHYEQGKLTAVEQLDEPFKAEFGGYAQRA